MIKNIALGLLKITLFFVLIVVLAAGMIIIKSAQESGIEYIKF